MQTTNYAVVIEPMPDEEDGGFVATVPDLPGCMSDGDTREEAARNVEDAVRCWLEEARALGRAVPLPRAVSRIQFPRPCEGRLIELSLPP
jgi:predicted RNase H-like HicB family nuclease